MRFELKDYRKIGGRFDRIVSVGMFEHMGVNHYATYFRKIGQLLADDGVALIHTIGRWEPPTATDPFIAKYIFPGGYIPALSEMVHGIERSGLIIADIEVLRLHYAKTLRAWRERFLANWDKAAAIRDERFRRMWEYYLAVSETAFRYQGLVAARHFGPVSLRTRSHNIRYFPSLVAMAQRAHMFTGSRRDSVQRTRSCPAMVRFGHEARCVHHPRNEITNQSRRFS